MTPAERDQCISFYLQGTTLDRLAEIFDRDRETVRRLVLRRGANRGKWRDAKRLDRDAQDKELTIYAKVVR